MQKVNERKAGVLYAELDRSPFWTPHSEKDCRSLMNVTFRLPTEDLERLFVKESTAAGFDGLKGHRSVGGLRASIYNAFPEQGLHDLVSFMRVGNGTANGVAVQKVTMIASWLACSACSSRAGRAVRTAQNVPVAGAVLVVQQANALPRRRMIAVNLAARSRTSGTEVRASGLRPCASRCHVAGRNDDSASSANRFCAGQCGGRVAASRHDRNDRSSASTLASIPAVTLDEALKAFPVSRRFAVRLLAHRHHAGITMRGLGVRARGASCCLDGVPGPMGSDRRRGRAAGDGAIRRDDRGAQGSTFLVGSPTLSSSSPTKPSALFSDRRRSWAAAVDARRLGRHVPTLRCSAPELVHDRRSHSHGSGVGGPIDG